jgi:hypothetical protein
MALPDNTMTVAAGGNLRASVSADRATSQFNETSVIQEGVTAEQRSRPSSAHEFGHMIGLPHPGAHLTPQNPNSDAAYNFDRAALMGRQDQLRAVYFEQWADELGRQYPACGKYVTRRK